MNKKPSRAATEVSDKLCACGCGNFTLIAFENNRANGDVKGKPREFCRGHSKRSARAEDGPNPSGICQCGCGEETKRCTSTNWRQGISVGQYRRLLRGHQQKMRFQKGFAPGILVDPEDEYLGNDRRWHISDSTGYAYSVTLIKGKKTRLTLHRVITNCPPGLEVDHINHNRLDNRRSNLRCVTHAENMRNSVVSKGESGYRSVGLTRSGKWHVTFHMFGKRTYLGRYADKNQAIAVADAYRTKIGVVPQGAEYGT